VLALLSILAICYSAKKLIWEKVSSRAKNSATSALSLEDMAALKSTVATLKNDVASHGRKIHELEIWKKGDYDGIKQMQESLRKFTEQSEIKFSLPYRGLSALIDAQLQGGDNKDDLRATKRELDSHKKL